MRTQKPIILLMPSLLIKELNKYLIENPPKFNKYDIIYFYYVVHYITSKQLINKDSEYINLNIKNLQAITVSNINRYIKYLKNGEFIISDNTYIIGKKSLGYKLNEKYLHGVEKIEINKELKIYDKIVNYKRKQRAHNNRNEPFLKDMRAFFMKINLNYADALKWIEDNANYANSYYYNVSLMQLQDKRFRYFKRNNTNKRLDTNFTNLKKELRNFIKGDFVCIDLKNSQPFFLNQLIKSIINKQHGTSCCYLHYNYLIKVFGFKAINHISKIHQNQKKSKMVNLKNFSNSVLKGKLYDNFINLFSENLTRKQAKNIMFKVMFSRNRFYDKNKKFIPYENDKKKFAQVYPFVYDVIKILKEKNHALLAITLQKLESYIFIDCIAKELVKNNIIPLTIHDSVIVETKSQKKAMQIIEKIFLENFSVIPSFHIEKLNN